MKPPEPHCYPGEQQGKVCQASVCCCFWLLTEYLQLRTTANSHASDGSSLSPNRENEQAWNSLKRERFRSKDGMAVTTEGECVSHRHSTAKTQSNEKSPDWQLLPFFELA